MIIILNNFKKLIILVYSKIRMEGRGIDLPLEGAVGYSEFKVTKVSKVS